MNIRELVRDLAGNSLLNLGLTSTNTLTRGLTVLTIHRVLPSDFHHEYPLTHLAITPCDLEWLITALSPTCKILPITEALHRYFDGDSRNEKPLVSLTFDDGYEDNFLYAAPILAKHGVSATFYVVADLVEHNSLLPHDRLAYAVKHLVESDGVYWIPRFRELNLKCDDEAKLPYEFVKWNKTADRQKSHKWDQVLSEEAQHYAVPNWEGVMSWSQIRQLDSVGHEIGSHSLSHDLLSQIGPDKQRLEIVDSKARIESKLSHQISSFCYPNGDVGSHGIQEVRNAGYENAVTTSWGYVDQVQDPYQLKRFDVQRRTLLDRNGRRSLGVMLLRFNQRLL